MGEAHVQACVYAAMVIRGSGKGITAAEVLKVVAATGVEGVQESTAATVVCVLNTEQKCLQLQAATAPAGKPNEESDEEVDAAGCDTFMGYDDY